MLLKHLFCSLSETISVLDFERPKDALDAMAKETPDLVVLDYIMPGMNGLDAANQIRSICQRYVPIVMVSVLKDIDLRQEAFDLGCIDFLSKPINLKEMQARCKSIMSMVEGN